MNDVLVLCYHAVSEDWPADLAVRPDALESQVTRLLQEGYVGVTFTEAVLGPPRRKLAVTFDDGFASVLEIGKPILDRLGVPGTIFAVADFADEAKPLCWDGIDHWRGGRYDAELRSLGWPEFRAMADEGWEVGSHTCSHPRLTGCPDDELDRQLAESRAACERGMGRACTSIAYPYGDMDGRVSAAAERAGYVAGASLPARWHAPDPLNWPRVGVYHGDDERRFALKTSRVVRGVRRLLEPRLPRLR